MEQILKEFLDNDEAIDAYISSKTVYLSKEDVDVLLKRQKEQLILPLVSSSFKVGAYSLYKTGESEYCHWSKGLKMVIEKDGVIMKLEGEEIENIARSLPRTFGGTY